jgi:hypothetical protein
VKNQTDLIVTIVAVLCMLIGVGVFFGTRKEAVQPSPPEQLVTAPLQLPAANVVMANSLPNAGSGSQPGGGGLAGGGGPSAAGGRPMIGLSGPSGVGGGMPQSAPPAATAGGGGGGPQTAPPAATAGAQ